LWSQSGALRRYLIASIAAAFLLMIVRALLGEPVIAPFAGLFQRIFAFTVAVPIGVAAWFLAGRFQSATLPPP